MKQLRSKVYNLIREDDENRLSGTIFDSIIMGFIILNVVFIILDTFSFPAWYGGLSTVVEGIAAAVFTAEYIARVWTAPLLYPKKRPVAARLKYVVSFMALIDLVSILPFYLPFFLPMGFAALRSLRILRLLRVFKIGRYTDALSIIYAVFRKKAHQLFSSVLVVFLLMLIASVIMFDVESAAQPEKFDSVFSAFWWAVSTVTTIGYGDLYPITTTGKVLGAAIALLGIGLVAVPTGIISAGFIEESRLQENAHRAKHGRGMAESPPAEERFCPHCGRPMEGHGPAPQTKAHPQ